MASMVCLRQVDIKVLIAYSSVAHIGLVVSCILRQRGRGVLRGVAVIIAHSFSSSWMFFYRRFCYGRRGRRNLLLRRGHGAKVARFLFFWFLACVGNLGGPPTLNLWVEIIGVVNLIRVSVFYLIPISLALFLRVGYTLILFRQVNQGGRH